jgi:hypothetical protein
MLSEVMLGMKDSVLLLYYLGLDGGSLSSFRLM